MTDCVSPIAALHGLNARDERLAKLLEVWRRLGLGRVLDLRPLLLGPEQQVPACNEKSDDNRQAGRQEDPFASHCLHDHTIHSCEWTARWTAGDHARTRFD